MRLSLKIESEMMTLVKISERENKGSSFGFNQSVLVADEEGRHLYEVVEGSGWNTGNIARKLPAASWYIDSGESVQFTGSEQVLLFRMKEAESPFLEQTALWLTETTQMADRAFSLAEAEQFAEALPLLAALGVVLAAGIVFWTCRSLLNCFGYPQQYD